MQFEEAIAKTAVYHKHTCPAALCMLGDLISHGKKAEDMKKYLRDNKQDAKISSNLHPAMFEVSEDTQVIPTYPLLGLFGKVGELTEKVLRGNATREDMLKECGDILWYLTDTLNRLGYDLDECIEALTDKIVSRTAKGTIHGDGDNR